MALWKIENIAKTMKIGPVPKKCKIWSSNKISTFSQLKVTSMWGYLQNLKIIW